MSTDVGAFADLPDGAATRVEIDGVPVAVVRIGNDVFAVNDICSHANVSLSSGEVWCAEREIECPRHGSTFSLVDGAAQTLPATQPIAVYPVEVVDGRVLVTVPEPAADTRPTPEGPA